jgi:hypothetical protein
MAIDMQVPRGWRASPSRRRGGCPDVRRGTPFLDHSVNFEACGYDLSVERRGGAGVDRTQIRELLRVTPLEALRDEIGG